MTADVERAVSRGRAFCTIHKTDLTRAAIFPERSRRGIKNSTTSVKRIDVAGAKAPQRCLEASEILIARFRQDFNTRRDVSS